MTTLSPLPETLHPTRTGTRRLRTGYVITAVAGVFLLFDAVIHVLGVAVARDAMVALGYPAGAAVSIGLVELACLALYVVPRTAPLGAVLLTGYLGGAVAAQLRIEAPLFSSLLFPVYVGVLVWAGLWQRDARVRALLQR